jgi:hypothetical protein
LEATASTEVTLAAFVITPSAAGVHVVESFMAHENLDRTKAQSGRATAQGLTARSLAQGNVKIVAIIFVRSEGIAVFSFDFLLSESFFREAKETHVVEKITTKRDLFVRSGAK